MDDGALDHGVRAREANALPLETQLGEDQVRGRRPDIDPDRAQAQTLRGDIAFVIVVVAMAALRMGVRQVYARVTPGP